MHTSTHTAHQQNTSFPFNQWDYNRNKPKPPNPKPYKQQTRSYQAQSLLEAILALLMAEAKNVGLLKEATLLTNNILKRNYLDRRI